MIHSNLMAQTTFGGYWEERFDRFQLFISLKQIWQMVVSGLVTIFISLNLFYSEILNIDNKWVSCLWIPLDTCASREQNCSRQSRNVMHFLDKYTSSTFINFCRLNNGKNSIIKHYIIVLKQTCEKYKKTIFLNIVFLYFFVSFLLISQYQQYGSIILVTGHSM